MRCPSCGSSYDDSERRCPYCGERNTGSGQQAEKHFSGISDIQKSCVDAGTELYDTYFNSVIEITAYDGKEAWKGTGFLISNTGYAITNTHVAASPSTFKGAKLTANLPGGDEIPAQVIKLCDNKAGQGNGVDVALIKLERMPKDGVVVRLGSSSKVRNGEQVYIIGNSLGYGNCITRGIVSDKLRYIEDKAYMMTDCAINGGNSGGPMFNSDGEVIGVVVASFTNAKEGMNLAIPIDIAVKALGL